MLQENLPLNVFSSRKTLQKEINIYIPWPLKKEKNLIGNTFGPTREEFFSGKAMVAESLLFEVKRPLNISKTLWTTLEIPTKFLHLNQFEISPILPSDMVSGLHAISLSWCVVLNVQYFSIYSIIMAMCKTCDCAYLSSCHKYIQSPNDSSCYSNQQQPKTTTSFTRSACVSSTIAFFNLSNTELYNLLLFDNSDLSNFIESFPCDLSAQFSNQILNIK